jgi:hypothetical protein
MPFTPTHANRASGEKYHATGKIDELRTDDRHDLAEKTDETSTRYEEGAVEKGELLSLLN